MKQFSILFFLSLLLISCGSAERSVNSTGTTNVVLDLGQRETASASISYAPGSITTAAASPLPSYITTIQVLVTDGEGGEVLVDTTVDVTGRSSVTLEVNVPNGNNRVFIIYAYDHYGYLTYVGSETVDLTGTRVSLSIMMSYVNGD